PNLSTAFLQKNDRQTTLWINRRENVRNPDLSKCT
ncbi:hypothetical protein FHS55_004709, partial [Angulomicrobium tetraedrale]|nr:hypothetical protein [Ancylobacter tetraedralis]